MRWGSCRKEKQSALARTCGAQRRHAEWQTRTPLIRWNGSCSRRKAENYQLCWWHNWRSDVWHKTRRHTVAQSHGRRLFLFCLFEVWRTCWRMQNIFCCAKLKGRSLGRRPPADECVRVRVCLFLRAVWDTNLHYVRLFCSHVISFLFVCFSSYEESTEGLCHGDWSDRVSIRQTPGIPVGFDAKPPKICCYCLSSCLQFAIASFSASAPHVSCLSPMTSWPLCSLTPSN